MLSRSRGSLEPWFALPVRSLLHDFVMVGSPVLAPGRWGFRECCRNPLTNMGIWAWRRGGVAQILESMNITYFIAQLLLELNTVCQIVTQKGETRITVSKLLGHFWSTFDLQNCISFRCTRWFDPCGHYQMTNAVRRVALCLHTRLPHETQSLYPWRPEPLIHHPCHSVPRLLPSGNHCTSSESVGLFPFLFACCVF